MLRLKTPYRWQMAAVSCACWKALATGAWDCVVCRKCGNKANFARRDRCKSCGRNRPSAGASQAAASGSKSGESRGSLSFSLSKCGRRCGRRRRERSRRHSNPRSAADQPTAHSARKQLEQEVAALSKLWSAYQRQHKAAVDACVLLAETGGKVKEQRTRVQQASVEAGLETSREAGAHHAGCGGDVATLLSLLAAASARGSRNAAYRRACATMTWNHSWSVSASCTLTSLGRSSPRHRVRKHRNRQHHTTPFRVSQAQEGAGWVPGRPVLVLVVLLIASAAVIWPLNQLGLLQ